MTKDEAIRAVARLMARYPSSKLGESSVEEFAAALLPHDAQAVRHAFDRCSWRLEWFPSLAHILSELATGAGMPEPEVAWAIVAASRGVDPDRKWPDLLRRALRDAGGSYALQTATDGGRMLREQFLTIYTAYRDEKIRELAVTGFGPPRPLLKALPRSAEEPPALPADAAREPSGTRELYTRLVSQLETALSVRGGDDASRRDRGADGAERGVPSVAGRD